MTTININHDRGRFDADAAGSRLLWSRHQIVQLFRRYICEDRPVSAHFGNESKVMVTRALRLNSSFGRIYFEYGDHKAGNSSLVRSREVQFSVEDGLSKSQFTSPRICDVLLDGDPVFHIPIPDRVVQIDRRMHERIKIPPVSAPLVIFNLPNGRRVEGQLADLSAGGMGVIGFAENIGVRIGTVIRNCIIELGDGEQVCIDVETRYVRGFVDANGNPARQVGFRLVSRPKEFSDLLDAFTVAL